LNFEKLHEKRIFCYYTLHYPNLIVKEGNVFRLYEMLQIRLYYLSVFFVPKNNVLSDNVAIIFMIINSYIAVVIIPVTRRVKGILDSSESM